MKEKKPDLVFLMETKLQACRIEIVPRCIGFGNVFVVDNIGKSGSLAFFWNSEVNVEIQNYSRRHINALVRTNCTGYHWKFTGFYGHPEAAKRKDLWALLRHLGILEPLAWLSMGDYNETIEDAEKVGSSLKPRGQMAAFRETLECRLVDLGFNGPRFTWNNNG